jgi:brefeldin A-inhibited guanine nucleotide-exchange protein
MEKFAERYYLQNRDKFASADMAFILAFSTIMLQTNLHSTAIKVNHTCEDQLCLLGS